MSYRHGLIHVCDVWTVTTSRAPNGEILESEDVEKYSDLACRYTVRRIRRPSDADTAEKVAEIYLFVPETVQLEPDDLVKNIRDADGNVINAGPLEIDESLPKYGTRGRHHTGYVLERQ